MINIAGILPKNSHDRRLWPSMELKQLKKYDRPIDHQSINRPLYFWVRLVVSILRDTYALEGESPNRAFSKLTIEIKNSRLYSRMRAYVWHSLDAQY